MRFNAHCHVFNFQSVFCTGSLEILKNRIMESHFNEATADLILGWLKRFIENGGGFERDSRDLKKSDFTGEVHPGLDDLLAFVRLALLKDMDLVCDDMMEQLDADVAVLTLMMDILTEECPDDGGIFARQLAGTQRQMLRYPGRIFPFYAFTPWREDALGMAKRNLKNEGFVGVKLYPSLGYKINAQEVEMLVRYCDLKGVPLLQHCNRGGFKKDADSASEADPNWWRSYLEQCHNFKICFGHFGGQENILSGDYSELEDFTKTILAFMRAYPGRVFADVSFHNISLQSSSQDRYFKHLATLLEIPEFSGQILWGSDTFLLRSSCTETEYWRIFQEHVSAEHFKLMSQDNPARFLGFDPDAPAQSSWNVLRQIKYLKQKFREQAFTRDKAAPWLKNLLS